MFTIFSFRALVVSSCIHPLSVFSLGWSRFIKLEYHSLIKSHYILEPSSCKHIINLAIPPPQPMIMTVSYIFTLECKLICIKNKKPLGVVISSYLMSVQSYAPNSEFLKIIFNKISILTLSAVVSTLQATCFLLAMEHRRPSRIYKLTQGLGFSTEGFPPVPC